MAAPAHAAEAIPAVGLGRAQRHLGRAAPAAPSHAITSHIRGVVLRRRDRRPRHAAARVRRR